MRLLACVFVSICSVALAGIAHSQPSGLEIRAHHPGETEDRILTVEGIEIEGVPTNQVAPTHLPTTDGASDTTDSTVADQEAEVAIPSAPATTSAPAPSVAAEPVEAATDEVAAADTTDDGGSFDGTPKEPTSTDIGIVLVILAAAAALGIGYLVLRKRQTTA